MTSATYSFIPWLRQGIANNIVETDNLGIPNSNTSAIERPELNVKLRLNTTDINKKIKLHGPGDVLGIHHDAILKVHPIAGTHNFESNALAFIEFYEEDFPWRYTPANRVVSKKRLRPWLTLIVAKEDEYDFYNDGNGLPYVRIKSEAREKVFPNHLETWAWAHVHVNHSMNGSKSETEFQEDFEEKLRTNPDVAYSRLICPRRLERTDGGVKYHAFLIPTFETGRLAGLGEDPKSIPAQKSAWTTNGTANSTTRRDDFPVYHNWEFKTGQYGDFEALVSILKARTLGLNFGKRGMNIEMPGMGLNNVATSKTLGFEGALKPPSYSRENWPGDKGGNIAFNNKLKAILNIPQDIQESGNNPLNPYNSSNDSNVFYSGNVVDDPIVTPPIYGKWHALAKKVGESSNKKWVDDLNLDPRNRAVASMGAQIIRKNQEQFMEMAWEQIGDFNEANQRIREAELTRMINNAIYENNYAQLDEDQLLMISSAAQNSILIPDSKKGDSDPSMTFEAKLSETRIPNAARSAAFRKIIRPGKKAIKKINRMGIEDKEVTRTPIQKNLMTNFNLENEDEALTTAKKKANPLMVVPTSDVKTAIRYLLNIKETEAQENKEAQPDPEIIAFQQLFEKDFKTFSTNINNLEIVQTPPPITYLSDFSNSLFAQLNPLLTISDYITPMILSGNNTIEEIKPLMAYPEILEPMFMHLQNLSQDYIIPNIREIPENTVTLLENNQVFIESFMAGLNHEMANELLWREFPTDQRGSCFRNFWDDKDSQSTAGDNDILAMDEWTGDLGTHNQRINNIDGSSERKKNFIVLLIRGDLLKKFPNTVIFAQKAVSAPAGSPRSLADANEPNNIKRPIFQAKLEPDIILLSFDLTKEEASGDANDPGWFFVMQERPGEITFGLDESEVIPDSPATQWSDLEWGHLVGENDNLDNLYSIPCTSIRSSVPFDSPGRWGSNSADMAYILFQTPVIFARHAQEMLP
jgi:hypothetical protein